MQQLFIILFIVRASVFSIGGLGQDHSVFDQPLIDIGKTSELSLLLRPEISLLNEGMDIRSVFWTNPFFFRLSVPVNPSLQFSIGNQERFNQDFDVYYEEENLRMHLQGRGSVEEINGTVQFSYRSFRSAFRAGYLFGNSREVWDYFIGDYSLVDTFNYNYQGHILSGGIQFKFISAVFEGLGNLDIIKPSSDTSFNMPTRLCLKIAPGFLNGNAMMAIEKSLWDDPFLSPLRFQIGYRKAAYYVTYMYNPWYLEDITEHGVGIYWRVPVSKMGVVNLNLNIALRNKGELREFCITPQLKLEVNEFFTRRKK